MSSIPFADRTKSVAIFGKTGMGKTTFMEQLIHQDIDEGVSAIVLDPHGDLTERLLTYASAKHKDRLLVIKADADYPFGLNIYECDNAKNSIEVDRVVDEVLQVFKKLWGDNPILLPRMEHIITNTSRTIIANPRYTMAEIPALLTDKDKRFRDELIRHVKNPQVKHFWEEYAEIAKRPFDRVQYIESVSNRLSQFLSSEFLYKVVAQAHTTIDFHKLLDGGKTVIVSLPIGELGEGVTGLLGSLFLARLTSAVFAREKIHAPKRTHLYIDEYQRFATSFTSVLLREGRKFNLGTTIAVQSLANLGEDPVNLAAVLQVGTLICFQTIGQDAETLAKQFPLPDPVSLMKPEPVLVYSATPVEDIWHRGHTNSWIKGARDDCFCLVGALEDHPQQTDFPFDASDVLQEHPNWRELPDWEMSRSSREMLHQGIALLNEYYAKWMQHEYIFNGTLAPEELTFLLNITQCFSGVLGMRPTMEPFIEEEKWRWLLTSRQHQIDNLVNNFLEDNRRNWYKWGSPEFLRHSLEEEGFFKRIPVDKVPNVFYVDLLPNLRAFLYELGISIAEVDRLIQWRVRPYIPQEEEVLKNYIKYIVYQMNLPKEKLQLAYEGPTRAYTDIMIVISLAFIIDKQEADYLRKTGEGIDERRYDIAREKAFWQAMMFFQFMFRIYRCGISLEKEPVFSQSHTYRDVEYSRRTFSDLQNELAMRLASLPPFTYYTQREGKAQEVKLAKPAAITGSAYAKALILTTSQKTFGKDWRRIEREIEHRQKHIDYQPAPIPKPQVKTGLPPAKPQI